jgi:hypothetical protein
VFAPGVLRQRAANSPSIYLLSALYAIPSYVYVFSHIYVFSAALRSDLGSVCKPVAPSSRGFVKEVIMAPSRPQDLHARLFQSACNISDNTVARHSVYWLWRGGLVGLGGPRWHALEDPRKLGFAILADEAGGRLQLPRRDEVVAKLLCQIRAGPSCLRHVDGVTLQEGRVKRVFG